MEQPSTHRASPPPSVLGLVLMGLVVGAAAIVLLPARGTYGVIGLALVLIGLGVVHSRRKRGQAPKGL
jgi:hypothetical protein